MVRGEGSVAGGARAGCPSMPVSMLLLLSALLPSVAVGCTSLGTVKNAEQGARASVADEVLRAEFDPLIAQHNERVARLTTIEARGIIEIRYRDESGSHFEQTDLELALTSGGRGSLKLSKLGDLFWIGGDGRLGWIFDLRSKPPTAVVSENGDLGVERAAAHAIRLGDLTVLSPASLRFVMGLTAIPSDACVVPLAQAASSTLREAYRVAWRRGGMEVALAFGADGYVSELELREVDDAKGVAHANGKVLATSRISDYEPAHVDALSQLAWPRVGTRVRVTAATRETSALLVLTEPWAQVRRMKDRYFDLTALMQHFQPETVSYVTQPAPQEPAPKGPSPSGNGVP